MNFDCRNFSKPKEIDPTKSQSQNHFGNQLKESTNAITD
jgi:hypothetical protein